MKPPGAGGPNRPHLSFGFLRVFVAPWCKGLVFGCGDVALRFKVLFLPAAKKDPALPRGLKSNFAE